MIKNIIVYEIKTSSSECVCVCVCVCMYVCVFVSLRLVDTLDSTKFYLSIRQFWQVNIYAGNKCFASYL
jgi:hypothetical protein